MKGMEYMISSLEQTGTENENYGAEYRPLKDVYVIKKDGSREAFNVQKVINAVGKSADRALTKFTDEEKLQKIKIIKKN